MKYVLCDLKIIVNENHTFFVNQAVLCSYSKKLNEKIKKENAKKKKNGIPEINIVDFPGGPYGFEMVSRFCYDNENFQITPFNVFILHCSAVLLEMIEEMADFNLLSQTERFLDGLSYWKWDDLLICLKTCESFSHVADSSGLSQKLILCLVSKILEHLELSNSPSSSSSPKTPDSTRSSLTREWWFDDLAILTPNIIVKFFKTLGPYNEYNKSLTLTRFILHYLTKSNSVQRGAHKLEYSNLANTAVYGAVVSGRGVFSCRRLFWVLRIVSKFGLSKECRCKLESVIGCLLDQATLDDLLVSGNNDQGSVYDVNLVLRLIRVFVHNVVSEIKEKKVGRLIDKYLGEISPDQSLKVSKFLSVAESLPDSARDSFDGVYRALEIYLEAHTNLTPEDRLKLCRCINYEKLSLEACKDLAKNPRIPPQTAIQAMVSQKSKLCKSTVVDTLKYDVHEADTSTSSSEASDDKDELKFSLRKMQNRVAELENLCLEMRSQMNKMVKGRAIISRSAHQRRGMTKLC